MRGKPSFSRARRDRNLSYAAVISNSHKRCLWAQSDWHFSCACCGSPEATEDGHRNASAAGYSCSSPATGKTSSKKTLLCLFFQRVDSCGVSEVVSTVVCRQLPEGHVQILMSFMGLQLTSYLSSPACERNKAWPLDKGRFLPIMSS